MALPGSACLQGWPLAGCGNTGLRRVPATPDRVAPCAETVCTHSVGDAEHLLSFGQPRSSVHVREGPNEQPPVKTLGAESLSVPGRTSHALLQAAEEEVCSCDSLEEGLGSLPQASLPFADFALHATVITLVVKSDSVLSESSSPHPAWGWSWETPTDSIVVLSKEGKYKT